MVALNSAAEGRAAISAEARARNIRGDLKAMIQGLGELGDVALWAMTCVAEIRIRKNCCCSLSGTETAVPPMPLTAGAQDSGASVLEVIRS